MSIHNLKIFHLIYEVFFNKLCFDSLSQGFEWHHLRSKLLPQLSRSSTGEHIIKEVCSVGDELVQKIKKECSHGHVLKNFEKIIYRFGLEGSNYIFRLSLLNIDYLVIDFFF